MTPVGCAAADVGSIDANSRMKTNAESAPKIPKCMWWAPAPAMWRAPCTAVKPNDEPGGGRHHVCKRVRVRQRTGVNMHVPCGTAHTKSNTISLWHVLLVHVRCSHESGRTSKVRNKGKLVGGLRVACTAKPRRQAQKTPQRSACTAQQSATRHNCPQAHRSLKLQWQTQP